MTTNLEEKFLPVSEIIKSRNEFEIFSSAPLQGKEKNFTQKFAGKLFSTILSSIDRVEEHSYFFSYTRFDNFFSFFFFFFQTHHLCAGEGGGEGKESVTRFCEPCIGGGNRAVPMWPRDYKRL